MKTSILQNHLSFHERLQKKQAGLAIENLSIMKSIQALFVAMNSRDRLTALHSLLVGEYSFLLAEQYDPANAIWYYYGGLCHDLGKLAMSDKILKENYLILEHEKPLLRHHVTDGVNILTQLNMPKTVVDIARYHHERMEGNGYLEGLQGNEIPLSGRIAAITDVYSALVIRRSYQCNYSPQEAINVLKDEPRKYDQTILASFVDIVQQEDINLVTNILNVI